MTDPELVLRPFEAGDQEAARRLILEGLGEHFGFIDETRNPDVDDIWANYVTQGHIFVVVQSGQAIVGSGALVLEGEGVGQLVRISVDQRYRRRGIGKMIVEYLVGVARQQGLKGLLVETNNSWDDAIGLYMHIGFIVYRQDDIGTVFSLALL